MNFGEIINSLKPEVIKSVQEIIRIRSVKDIPRPGAPFGEGINNALLYVLNLAASMGFKTKYIDGYMGYAEYGEGEEMVGVLGHVDIVPEGSGWTFDPYEGYIHDNKLYGRGAVDDKGPIVAALYGLKAIKDAGIKLNKRVRIIFGTDEECGWHDVDWYLKNEEAPHIGFTPDGLFPVINAEKGLINIEFKKEIVRKSKGMMALKSLKGGEAVNTVPSLCTCELRLKDMAKLMLRDTLELYSEKNNINMALNSENDMDVILSRGVSCHSSEPHKGKSAIMQLVMFINQFNLGQNDVSDFIKFLSRYIGMETDGKALSIDFKDDYSGSLTLSLGLLSIDEEKASAVINIRYPVTADYNTIINKIQEIALDKKIEMSVLKHNEPLYVEKDSVLITTLLDAYKKVTGDSPYTMSIGGQTYAKAFKNMVAYGAVFPVEEDCAHMPNEYIEIDNLIKCTNIYAQAIYDLSK